MKTQTGIWIDGTRALIVTLTDGKENVHELLSEIENPVHHYHEGDRGSFWGTRHVNNEKKISERRHHQVDQYIENVLREVQDTDEIFLMGPSEMKTKLRRKIETDDRLKDRLKGYESTEQLTLNQCVARVKEFFRG